MSGRPSRVDFTAYDVGQEVDFRCTQAVPPFAINGTVTVCARCGRRGVETHGAGGVRFVIHSVTVDLDLPAADWPSEACRFTPLTVDDLGAGPQQVRALTGGEMCGPPLESLTPDGWAAAIDGAPAGAARCACGCRYDGHRAGGGACMGNGSVHQVVMCPQFRPERRGKGN